jgi:hypothetical protein
VEGNKAMKNRLLSSILVIITITLGLNVQPLLAADLKFTTYVFPAITDDKILPTTTIPDQYISNEIAVSGSPGEYVSATFVIRANGNNISSLLVSATDLTGTQGSIAAANIDIKVVKLWYQGGYTLEVGAYGKYLTPELLLKNDRLVKVDGSIWNNPAGNNYLETSPGTYTLISEKSSSYTGQTIVPISERPIQDTAALQPLDILNGANQQFWITIKVPATVEPGNYSSVLNLTSGSNPLGALQLKLAVLPIGLAQPAIEYSFWYEGKLNDPGSISSKYKNEIQMKAEISDMLDHGVTNPVVSEQKDLATFVNVARIRQAAGLEAPTLFSSGDYSNWKGTIDAVKPYGVTQVYFFSAYDEPRPEQLPSFRTNCINIHKYGGKVFASLTREYLTDAQIASVADVLDLAFVSGPPSQSLAATFHSFGHQIYSYANPQTVPEFPETYRRNYGLLLWQNNYDGAMDYAYQSSYNDIWNDFDYWGGCRDHAMAYPTMNGAIDTIQWEGFRQGVNDVRYLTTLLTAIDTAKAAGRDTSTAAAWLANLKSSDLTTVNLDSVRTAMINFIMTLQNPEPEAELYSITLTPTVPAVETVVVEGSIASVAVAAGNTQTFAAQGYDSQGNPINGLTYTWTVTDDVAGQIDANGTFTAGNMPGTYPDVIRVTSRGVTATATITVVVTYQAWDVNQDGATNVLDMILVGQHMNESGEPGWILEDVNQDGLINQTDINLISHNLSD